MTLTPEQQTAVQLTPAELTEWHRLVDTAGKMEHGAAIDCHPRSPWRMWRSRSTICTGSIAKPTRNTSDPRPQAQRGRVMRGLHHVAELRSTNAGDWTIVAEQVVLPNNAVEWDVYARHKGGNRIPLGQNLHADCGAEMARLLRLIDWTVLA